MGGGGGSTIWPKAPLSSNETLGRFGKEGNALFNETLNTFYLRSYGK